MRRWGPFRLFCHPYGVRTLQLGGLTFTWSVSR